MNFSIRKRLLLWLISLIVILWSFVTYQVYYGTQHEVEELFDANLAQNARILMALIKHEMTEYEQGKEEWIELEENLAGHKYEHKLAFLVRANHDGHILIRSTSTVLFPMPQQGSFGFNDYQGEYYLWRVFTLQTDTFFVQTGERYDIRNELITKIVWGTLTILIIGLLILLIFVWFIVGNSFKPLQKVASEIAARTPNQLQALKMDKIPLEIKILINELNSLFSRLTRAFENEHRFTADAAHELRTPLAGLKIQAQVAQRTTNIAQNQQALQQILIGVDQATHLVNQLLNLARMDAARNITVTKINMYELMTQLITDFIQLAIEKDIDLGLKQNAVDYIVLANQDMLYLMYRNLLDNSIRYTPKGGKITIYLDNFQAKKLTTRIIDTGKGISTAQLEHIFERFYRGEHQNIQGSGLGLSIVKRIAELHHLKLEVINATDGGGLEIQIAFQQLKLRK
ncbi:MAG: sensor histidine kinase N-terminal domain-containing protein [Thiomargarita sp.]|nr:sensor histidine kinase N-terminal domain-containing protein [Thiomargarita sp.]